MAFQVAVALVIRHDDDYVGSSWGDLRLKE